MGLSVVRDIVSSHGGLMLVESRVNHGTTVSIYLPVLQARVSSVSDEGTSLPRGHEGILFVAAEESRAKRGREMLESLGYYTVPAQVQPVPVRHFIWLLGISMS